MSTATVLCVLCVFVFFDYVFCLQCIFTSGMCRRHSLLQSTEYRVFTRPLISHPFFVPSSFPVLQPLHAVALRCTFLSMPIHYHRQPCRRLIPSSVSRHTCTQVIPPPHRYMSLSNTSYSNSIHRTHSLPLTHNTSIIFIYLQCPRYLLGVLSWPSRFDTMPPRIGFGVLSRSCCYCSVATRRCNRPLSLLSPDKTDKNDKTLVLLCAPSQDTRDHIIYPYSIASYSMSGSQTPVAPSSCVRFDAELAPASLNANANAGHLTLSFPFPRNPP